MLKFSANLTFMYRELPLVERFAAARQDGFDAVEIISPENASIPDLANAATDAGIDIILCNAPVGDFLEGGPGLSAVPGREAQFRKGIDMVRQVAEMLSCPSVNIGPSRIAEGSDKTECLDVLARNLAYAADMLAEANIQALIEPLNTYDIPNTCLSRVEDALTVLNEAGQVNAGLQFDIYHMAQMESDFMTLLEDHIGRIGHIQFADVPGRGEPGSGELDFGAIFELINRLDYTGFIGAEYKPVHTTSESLDWLRKYREKDSQVATRRSC